MRGHIPLILTTLSLAACQVAPPAGPPAARAVLAPAAPLYRVAATEAAAAPIVTVGAAARSKLAVTVYNENMGVIADTRDVPLTAGRMTLRFAEVAEQVDGTSVSLSDVIKGGLTVLEQIFAFDVLTPQKLLEAYVGKDIRFRLSAEGSEPSKIVDAVLVSAKDGLIVRIGDEVHVNPKGEVILPDVPAGFSTSPTLEWLVEVDESGTRPLTGTYRTRGLGWQADYSLTLAASADRADLAGWAAITNRSGADYPDASLTLVAGDLSQVPKGPVPMPAAGGVIERAADQFMQQPLAEFHRYLLDRPATIEDQETKQLKLFEADGVAVERRYVFDSQRMIVSHQPDKPSPVLVMIRFANTEANRLGRPLPRGVVRLYELDEKGNRSLVGEDAIGHTPTGETLDVKMGQAFDVVGERTQTKFDQIGTDVREESWRITLRNQKEKAVTVEVVEHLWGDWQVLEASHPYDKKSASELVFKVSVPAKGEAVVTYSARFGNK